MTREGDQKKTDAFHIQFNREIIAGIRQFLILQPIECGYCCAKEECHTNLYSFIKIVRQLKYILTPTAN